MGAFKLFHQSCFSYNPIPVGIREILFLTQAPCDFWIYQNDIFEIIFKKNDAISHEILKNLVRRGAYQLFVEPSNICYLRRGLGQSLREVSRSLSAKDSVKNARRQMSLLSINMGHLYQDPINDEALSLQFRSTKNLVNFLLENKEFMPELYRDFAQQSHHYIIGHPLLSSILLSAFLKSLHSFSNHEIELLFLTNYLKDIGMALIPTETFDKKKLNNSDKTLIGEHTQNSLQILQGRVPLNDNYLNIINNHHNYSMIETDHGKVIGPFERHPKSSINPKLAEGVETTFIVMMDMITAMISSRPYRQGMDMFSALNKIKILFVDNYPQEFRQLVYFLQKFFTQTK